jgi:hypothetical protein
VKKRGWHSLSDRIQAMPSNKAQQDQAKNNARDLKQSDKKSMGKNGFIMP